MASSINPSVPAALDGIINRLLSKDPDDRYPAAEDLRADLRRFREGHPLTNAGFPPPINPSNGAPTTAMSRPSAPVPASQRPGAHHSPPPHHRAPDTGSRAVIDTTRAIPASAAMRQIEPVEEYYEPPSRTGVFVIMLAGLLLLLVGLIVWISGNITGEETDDTTPDVETIQVPRVVGEAERTAENRLIDEGFLVRKVFEENDEFEAGLVFAQDPDGGEQAPDGSEVTIFIVQAAEQVSVPDVQNLTRAEANDILVANGFEVRIEREESDEVEEDRVVSQSLEPGQMVNKGSSITLVISTGPQQATIPILANMATADATALLTELGFGSPQIIQEGSTEVAPGLVIRTEPQGGTTVDLSTPIRIFVSGGSEGQAQVPAVEGLQQAVAEQLIRSRGFNVKVETMNVDNPGQNGIVITQSPGGNSIQQTGSDVTIHVGRFNNNSSSTATSGSTTSTTEPTTTTEDTTTTSG
jgi:serine/threonine-protein kinase